MIRFNTMRRRLLAAALAGIVAATGAGAPVNAGPHPENLRKRHIIKTAYYEPQDTYFQLAEDVVTITGAGRWSYAVTKARNVTYRERQGRLAKIDSARLHRWIVETFDFSKLQQKNGVWVGLRYWCNVRELTWTDGELHRAGAFAPWDTPWYRTDIRCGKVNMPFMGVYYEPKSARWRAAGLKKNFRYYLIEFPPTKPQTANADE